MALYFSHLTIQYGTNFPFYILSDIYNPARKKGEALLSLRDLKTVCCCVSVQGLHPSKAELKGRNNPKAPPNAASYSLSLEDASWPHISQDSLHARKRAKKERNGDVAWCRLSLSRAWAPEIATLKAKHLVTQPGNAPKSRPSYLKNG